MATLDLDDKGLIDEFLSSNEQVLWAGRPEKKSYKIKNIRHAGSDFVGGLLVCFLCFWPYDLIVHHNFFMESTRLIFISSVTLFFSIIAVDLMIKLLRLNQLLYCVTDRRILIFTKKKVVDIDKLKIKNKKTTATAIERALNVHTIKIFTDDPDEDLQLESIDDQFEL